MKQTDKLKKTGSFNKKGYFTALGICCAMVGIACFNAYSQTTGEISRQLESVQDKPDVTASFDNDIIPAAEKKEGIKKENVTERVTAVTTVTSAPETEEPQVTQIIKGKFFIPLNGEIIQDFSGDELVRNSTTGAWQTHNGIDISGTAGDEVKAMTSGKVVSVFEDPLWGAVVEIDHGNGITGRYCGLNRSLNVEEGMEVSSGDIIGAAGNTADIETAMDTHVHFEVIKNKKYVNPVDIINNRG